MPKYDEQTLKNICLKGDYKLVVSYLSDLDDGNELLEKYKSIYERGAYFLETKDEKIVDFLHCYEDYLKWALINEVTTEECKESFLNKFEKFFPNVCNFDEIGDSVKAYFKERGYYAQFGVTRPYPDLYLWSKQTMRIEEVELPEAVEEINVCEMDGIITRGWLNYLSMNKIGAGGWVTQGGANYFKDKYDIHSDDFKISLIKHEAQHFHDIKNYPKMQSTDLEYRAKLVELIYYREMECFFSFLREMCSDDDRTHPHSYASRKIIQALSNRIFGKELETRPDLWTAEGSKISSASLALLKEHSERLIDWDGESFIV